jgi:hypothetical protein
MAMLEQAPFVNIDSLEWRQNDEGRGVMWVSPAASEWPSPEGWPYAIDYINFASDGTVSLISIDLEYALSVQELIELVGEPDYYLARLVHPEAPCLMFELYWPGDGLRVTLEPLPGGAGLPPATYVLEADYFAPADDLTGYLSVSGHGSETSSDLFLSLLREWEGMGAVNSPDH